MINSIELKNWKTHKATQLDFSKGTNILIGQMGAGKSSVMDAISFALFGKFPAIQQRRVNVGGVITSRPDQEKDALVRLTFTVDDDIYTVERTFGLDGDAKAKLEKNGTYVQSQPQRVTEEVSRLLKVDYDLFSKAVYAEQNGLDYFLAIGAGDRKRQIDRLLGLDRFAAAQENATSVINKVRDMAEEGERLVAGFDAEKLRRQLDAATKEKDAAMKERDELSARAKKLKSEEKAKEEKLGRLKVEQTRKVTLNLELEGLKSRRALLVKEISEMQGKEVGDRADVERSLKELGKRLEVARNSERTAALAERKTQESLSKVRANLESAKQKVDDKKKLEKRLSDADLRGLESTLSRSNVEIRQMEKELASAVSSKEESEKWVRELRKHAGRCPVCERELNDEVISSLIASKEALIKKADESVGELRDKIDRRRADAERINKDINELRIVKDKLDELADVEKAVDTNSKQLVSASSEHERAKRERDSAAELVATLNKELSELGSKMQMIEKRESYVKQEGEVRTSIDSKSVQLSAIKVDDKDVDSAQKEVTDSKSSVSRLDAEIDAKGRYINDKESQLAEKRADIEKLDRIHADIAMKKDAVDNLVKFKNALEEAQAQMRARLIGAINDVMQDVWPELYPYGDYPGIMLDATADDYVLKVKTKRNGGTGWESVETIASGGERSIGCLAMRVAFALVLVPNLRWLILDEPTHNIDREGLGKFVGVFNEILPRIIDQVFIITHDELLKQVSSAKIYMFNRNKEESGATVVQEV